MSLIRYVSSGHNPIVFIKCASISVFLNFWIDFISDVDWFEKRQFFYMDEIVILVFVNSS